MPRKDGQKCAEIRDIVDKWEKYWTINRSLYYEWIDFIMGDQWKEDESKLFERYDKIPLIFNKLGVLANHLAGDLVNNTPNLQVLPAEGVDAESANIRQALVKDISLSSDARSKYQNCFWQSSIGGFSAYRIGIEYENNNSLDKVPRIYDFNDPNMAYFDLAATHPCKIDGMYSGFKTRISRKRFRDKWGEEIERQIGSSSITEDSTMAFADDDSITQVDHFEREPFKKKLYKLSDGSIVDDEEFNKLEKIKLENKKGKLLLKDGQVVSVVDKRDVTYYKIKHIQIAGDFVLDEDYFPSEDLPIIFVDQKSYYTKQGQQITRSFFKDVKDAQKYLNYLATQSAYIMKISRFDQFMAPRKCVQSPDVAQMWRDPSVVQGALIYDETPSGLKPEQIRPPELSASLTTQYERTLMDIQTGTGMYNAQLGEVGNEISGRAIEARTNRGTKNTNVPYNSLNLAIAAGGEIINQIIPHLYNETRQITLSMPDSESKPIMINEPEDEYGIHVKNDMTKGNYKIRIKAGPSYEGQKEMALESLQSVIMADKSGQIFPMIADLYAENLPLDNNIEIRNRLRTIVSPEIIQAGKTGQPLPPKPQQPSADMMMVQLKQAELQHKVQQAQQNYAAKQEELKLKQAEIQRKAIETHQDMSLSWEKLQAEKEEAAAELQETLLRYQAEMQRVQADKEINQSQNILKILLHKSKPQRESKEMS